MNTIKIKVEASGCTGDGYDSKETEIEKIINKVSKGDQLEKPDLEKIVKTIISIIKELKTLYPDEQTNVTYHNNNRIAQIQIKVEDINKENENVNLFNERSLFHQVAKHESLSQLILDYCHITDDGEEGSRIWYAHEYDEGPEAGTYAILALVAQNKKWISNYIEFLRTNDLDHEVEQMWHIEEIIKKYDWCEETCQLAIARLISCCGQAGTEQFEKMLENGLSDYLTTQKNRTLFLKNIIKEFKDYEQTPHGIELLEDEKEYYMKWRTQEINRFDMILTQSEVNEIVKEVALMWDLFNVT